jgi:hypothetical protein
MVAEVLGKVDRGHPATAEFVLNRVVIAERVREGGGWYTCGHRTSRGRYAEYGDLYRGRKDIVRGAPGSCHPRPPRLGGGTVAARASEAPRADKA